MARRHADDELLTIPQVAEILSMTPGALRKRIQRGQIPAVRIGGQFRMRASDLQTFIANLPRITEEVPYHQRDNSYFMRPADVTKWFHRLPDQDWEYVYILRCGPYYKIGRTNHLSRRLSELEIQLPQKPKLIHSLRTMDSRKTEFEVHQMFSQKRLNGEWFKLTKLDILRLRTLQVNPDGSIDHQHSPQFDQQRRLATENNGSEHVSPDSHEQASLFERRP